MEIPDDISGMMTCAEILTRMVAFDTVNGSISHKAEPERELAIYLESLASSWGLASRRCPVPSGGFNLFLSCEVSADAPWLLFDSHLDTVSTEGMVIDPLQALCKDGRVYGRGACDTKGSGAAMLWALREYSECKERRLNVGLLFSVDEEAGMTGAEAFTGGELCELHARSRVLGIIVGEPTGLRPVVAHGGLVRGKIVSRGIAAHSSDPSKGKSAISLMMRLIEAMETGYFPGIKASHPLAGRAVGSINVIRGGSQVNIIPDFCEVEFDRRVMPGECSKNVLREMESVVSHFSEASGDAIRIESPFTLEPMDSETHGDLKERVCAMLCARGCDATPQGAPWATNASHYGTLLPAVVLGPGDIAQAHTKDEWIALSQLDLAGRLYLDLMLRG